ncbi:hypothetical protein [Tunicatimonas pelagia]|uniref:hypothetical protein n=1 Tax=Tunicatimonas pelagia TaxID=931531 RepID=UPI0026660E21|nr:hypothetical protein [Tunicatimonas pelagia]WKN42759.1 hypothetical protein P0M28_27355 [Tunicatimonas pelagia]
MYQRIKIADVQGAIALYQLIKAVGDTAFFETLIDITEQEDNQLTFQDIYQRSKCMIENPQDVEDIVVMIED